MIVNGIKKDDGLKGRQKKEATMEPEKVFCMNCKYLELSSECHNPKNCEDN